MRCPFLREAQVKSCCASAYKKMILRTANEESTERCSSSGWNACPAAKAHQEDHPLEDHCPFLQESLVQYCSATPVAKYVPYIDGEHTRCGNENHQYCEIFVGRSAPQLQGEQGSFATAGPAYSGDTLHSRNHMWMNVQPDRTCHIGIDRFLAGTLREVGSLSYVTTGGAALPTVVLTVRGVDLQLVFPRQIEITAVNAYLRVRPGRIVSHPYTLGWLFEGVVSWNPQESRKTRADGDLIGRGQLENWMAQEKRRQNDFVRNELIPKSSGEYVTMLDGGSPRDDLISHLSRDEILKLFNEFFSPVKCYENSI